MCTQLPYGPFEFPGRYNTSLSPPRGPYRLCFAYRTVLLRNFIQPVRVSFVHNYHSPLEFNTVRYFFKTLIQPVRVSFVHNSRTVQHFTFTSKGRGFLSLWLDPTPFSLGHACSHVLPQSHHFQTVSTMSTSCMSTFECPKVIPYGLDLSLVPCRFLLHRTGFLSVIPYGLSVRTCGSHLAIPYGATLSTVRDNFSFFDTGWSKVNRTVFPFSSTVRWYPALLSYKHRTVYG